ncbi:MAG: Bis(5'-nucleosyl)-tetraphosphatase, symmetrical (EC [uncultured Sulfurovum sp.]|uniref:bis(5'-nucleosyl)-tetraphosphatase (symmetrical) n=1 Tax=uncultured Sulfurovum sp. TaxID=269237 RepID=A0A6S6T4G6_9BACT|nr:MAG: Bis(5'-nucleosyl)-tetraphosphatase, symmetrical (EC [uncultured Sulfurovum sp.]
MAVWAVGDIQGCFDSLQELLKKIDFNPKIDELWVAGDLVNRGDKSLETLNYLYSIKDSIKVVLGNHDIALIAAYTGIKKSNETIDPILEAPNVDELIHWLRQQPFLHWDFTLGYCMAHAGISPQFDFGMATTHAKRIEKKLQGRNYKAWLKHMYKKSSNKFNAKASSLDIEKYILSSFVAMRFCEDDGCLDFKQKGAPTEYKVLKKGLKPWFACPTRHKSSLKIIFGHWSTLGYYQDSNVLALDTGCLWGRTLTAARIDIKEPLIVSVQCEGKQNLS